MCFTTGLPIAKGILASGEIISLTPSTLSFLQRSFSRFSSVKLLSCFLLLQLVTSTSRAGVGYTHNYGDAQNWDSTCGWDGAWWDIVTVTIYPGFVPGEYIFQRNGAGGLGVRLQADGTWAYFGSNNLGTAVFVSQAYVDSTFSIFSQPPGSTASVDGEHMTWGGIIHDSCAGVVVVHGSVTITIGEDTPPDNDSHKCVDGKAGGDACVDCKGMARYAANLMTVSLRVTDTPLSYTPPVGPAMNFTVTYNQRDSDQSPAQAYSNFGPNWTFNWLSYVTDDPNTPSSNARVYVPGGGTETYQDFDPNTQSYRADSQSRAVLVRTSSTSYEKRFPNGSKQVFTHSDGSSTFPRLVFMTQDVDPMGNILTINYDASHRITSVVDALGQSTTLAYELPGDSLKVTKVTDPFGRFAIPNYTTGKLTSITDPVGISSLFGYQTGTNFINALTTPYGTATFATGGVGTNQWLNMTDPTGALERVEYRYAAPGISATDPTAVVPSGSEFVNANLHLRNTFYWDKKALSLYPPVDGVYDYTKAKITHWLRNSDGALTSGIVASEKMPLENRVWHIYPEQPDDSRIGWVAQPAQVARVLGDFSTQRFQYEYNSLGKTTKATDPAGRVMSYIYDSNQIDLLETRQTRGTNNELLRKLTYNSLHEPLTDTDAAGKATTYTYNTYGQMLTRKNAKNETTTYAYGGIVPPGCLASITSPPFNGVSAVTSFGYDSFKRVRTVTDTDQYTLTTDYDNLDRKTRVTYPDTTYEQFQYTDNVTGVMTLDLTGSRDRRGLWTYRHYNANRKMDSITDPANQTTTYGWCTCGALESITDPKIQITRFNRDLQSRVYQKVFADTTTIDYLFEGQTAPNTPGATSRLQSSTDAKSQRTNYSYFIDNNINQVSYTDTSGNPLIPPTPSVIYTYDPNYNRVASMMDGIGTTTYAYNPITAPPALGAGRLASIDAPLANDTITFNYDPLGRVTKRSINGLVNEDSWTFDSLGRVSTEKNKLGTFTNSYVGVTNRLSKIAYPGAASANYIYFPNAQDKRLQQIKNLNNNNQLISQFDYTYYVEGQVRTWTQNNPSLSTPQYFDLAYDDADQLWTAPLKNVSTGTVITQYTYGYDLASNRTSELVGTVTTTSTPNNVNEITSQTGGMNRTLTYDYIGSLTNDGSARTFEWDGANRLVAINYTGTTMRSEFSYDGLSRVAKIVEKTAGNIISTRKVVWDGNEKCEFRNAASAVTLRLYAQGQHAGTTAYFYTRDHLGSIREMFSGGGTVVARYDYDPYGRSTTAIGTTPTDFNFTGLYRHSMSNLDLATYRAYDPDLGRWVSRDPIGEDGGLNLYHYTWNNPSNLIDPFGLDAIALIDHSAFHGAGHVATLVGNNNTGWTYYSRNGYGTGPFGDPNGESILRTYPTYADFRRDHISDRYDEAYHMRTSLDQDLDMTTYGDTHYRDPYHTKWPPSNNCADLNAEILDAGGHRIPGNNSLGGIELPNVQFSSLNGSNMGRLWDVYK
jgi:RHS repeat-associated protein